MDINYSPDEIEATYEALTLLEGVHPEAYLDTATPKQITIGVGSNIQDVSNTEARRLAIEALFTADLNNVLNSDIDAGIEFEDYKRKLGAIITSGDLAKLNSFVQLDNLTDEEKATYSNLLAYQHLLPSSFTIPPENEGQILTIYNQTIDTYTNKVKSFLSDVSTEMVLDSNEKVLKGSEPFNYLIE